MVFTMKLKRIGTDMSKIFGIGLPRTGTASLSEALNIMGKPSQHSCMIHGNDKTLNSDKLVAHVNNSYYRNLSDLPTKDSLFILTTREPKEWNKSISRFPNMSNVLPSIQEYERSVRYMFKSLNIEDQLLVVNIFEDDQVFEKISNFVGVHLDKHKFPHVQRVGEEVHEL